MFQKIKNIRYSMIDLDLIKINDGFVLHDTNIVKSGLLSYLDKWKQKIHFQKHPLGFKYLKLGKISSSTEFRVHFWIDTNENHDDDLQIHDHSFDFESSVLSGSIINKKYIINHSEKSEGFIYEVVFKNDKSKLILKSSNCCISKTITENLTSGEFYKVRNDEFHESINRQQHTITLLRITKSFNKTARVFSPRKINSMSSFERKILSDEENTKMINQIIGLIQKQE